MDVKRTGIVLKPNNSRVVIRPFEIPNESRVERIIARVSALPEGDVETLLEKVLHEFHGRHQRTREFFLHRFDQVRKHLPTDQPMTEARRLLIGSYFTSEYALESARLAPRPVRPAGRQPAVHRQFAGDGRGAHFVHHLPVGGD
jgi:hypothetical protein